MGRGADGQSERASAERLQRPPGNWPSSKATTSKMSTVAWLALGITAVVLIAWTAVSVFRFERQSFVPLQQTFVIGISALDVLSDLEAAEAQERGYLLTGETNYLESYRSSRKALDDEFDRLLGMGRNNPKEQEQVKRLRYMVHQKLDELQAITDTRVAAGFDAARARVLSSRDRQLMDAIRQNIGGVVEEEESTLARFSREWQSRTKNSLAALVGSAVLAGCF